MMARCIDSIVDSAQLGGTAPGMCPARSERAAPPATTATSHRRNRTIALVAGVICHGTFLVAITAMMASLYFGLALGFGRLTGAVAILANATLLLQFPIVHSLLLSRPGRRLLARLAPRDVGTDLVTTTYATVASLQLLLTFVLWSPSGIVWWEPHGAVLIAFSAVYASAWLLLLKTMADAGLGVQTGFLGWISVLRGRKPNYGTLPTRGTFAYVRQPVYLAFMLTLWTAPVWTPDRLAIAVLWTAYCLVGPLLKERRYREFYGAHFDRYRSRVRYLLPRLTPWRDHESA